MTDADSVEGSRAGFTAKFVVNVGSYRMGQHVHVAPGDEKLNALASVGYLVPVMRARELLATPVDEAPAQTRPADPVGGENHSATVAPKRRGRPRKIEDVEVSYGDSAAGPA